MVALALDTRQNIVGRSVALVAVGTVCAGYSAAFNTIKLVTIARLRIAGKLNYSPEVVQQSHII